MLLVRPQQITEANLVSSSIPETDYAAWSGATTYALGARVISVVTHRVYESLVAGNLNHDPTVLANAQFWLDIAPTNKWAMFDSYNATQTTHASVIDFTTQMTGRIDSLALLNLSNALSVRIVMTAPADGVVFDETFSLVSSAGVSDWFTYFFEDVLRMDTFFVKELPTYLNPSVRIIITGDGGSPVGVGIFSIGLSKNLGKTLHDGASVGIVDYSRKDTDEFGNFILVQRSFAKRGSFQTRIDKAQVDGVIATLTSYRAVPAVYLASEDYGATLLFGIFREFNVEIDRPLESLCSIDLEGLT